MTSRTYNLKFLRGSYSAADATYGVANYGTDPYTYGQEASQSILAGVDYELLPFPGWHPAYPEWVYRVGDESRFSAAIVDRDNPSDAIDVSTVASAVVVLTRWTFANSSSPLADQYVYVLLTDGSNNTLYRDWLQTDLQTSGRFRVNIRIVFDSGRAMTIEGSDGVSMNVNNGPDV
jgi:hypothetical protein